MKSEALQWSSERNIGEDEMKERKLKISSRADAVFLIQNRRDGEKNCQKLTKKVSWMRGEKTKNSSEKINEIRSCFRVAHLFAYFEYECSYFGIIDSFFYLLSKKMKIRCKLIACKKKKILLTMFCLWW